MKHALCDICKTGQATLHFKEAVNGDVHETYICEECAAKKGYNCSTQETLSIMESLFGDKCEANSKRRGDDVVCPVCHMHVSEFKLTSRFGCAQCYTAFAGEVKPMLEAMHKGTRHAGKTPAAAAKHVESDALKRALDKAVADQNYEEAARLRDRINALGAESAVT